MIMLSEKRRRGRPCLHLSGKALTAVSSLEMVLADQTTTAMAILFMKAGQAGVASTSPA